MAADRFRLAAQAGTESRSFGLVRTRVEGHVLAPRTPRRARRPAIDTGSRYREDKLAIACGVARANSVPLLIVIVTVLRRARQVGVYGCHFFRGFLCEYGIRGQHWESRVGKRHDKSSVQRSRGAGYPNLAGKCSSCSQLKALGGRAGRSV